MATEIASLLITAESQTGDAERGLDRLNQKYDKTVENLKSGQGRVTSFGQANRKAAEDIDRHSQSIGNLRGQLQGGAQDIQRIGTVLTTSITLPLAAAGAAITVIGVKTSTSLNTLQAVTRATDAQMKAARQTARELGADLSLPGTSAADSALAMVELAKGGLSLDQSMKAARGTIELARAATIGEAQAATIAADALNTFSLAGDQADRVADLLAGAANASSGEITDMAQALAQAGAVAKGANLSIEDTATAISLLAKNGIKGSDAGTSLKTFLLSLQTPISNDAVRMMNALGLSVYDLQGQMKPLPTIISDFKTRIDQLNPQAQAKALREIFGTDAIRAARILFGEGKAGFDAMQAAITRQGSAAEIAGAKAKGLGGAWEGLKSTLETFAGDIFEDLEEPLTKIVKSVSDGVQFLADAWNSLGPSGKTAIATLLGIAAAAGPVLVVIGSVAGAVLGLAGSIASLVTAGAAVGGLAALGEILIPVGLVIGGLIIVITEWVAIAVAAAFAISKAWSTNFLGIRDLTFRAWNAIKTFVLDVWKALQAAYQLIMPELLTLTRTVLGAIQAFWTAHGEEIVAVIRFAWNVITTVIKTAIRVISSVVAGVLAIINGDWQKAWDMAVRAVEGFLTGFSTIVVKVETAMTTLLAFLISKAAQFYKTGQELAIRLVAGVIAEIYNGAPRIAAAIITVATALSNPVILAAYAAAGVAQARARNEAFEANLKVQESNKNPQRYEDEGEYAVPFGSATPSAGEPVKKTGGAGAGLPAGAVKSGGGSGENAAVRKFKLEAQIAEIMVQTVERLNQKLLTDSDYFYSQGIQGLDQYVTAKRKAADDLFKAENERNNQEAYALAASGIRGRQRDLQEAQLSEKVKATWQKHGVAINEIDRFFSGERLAIQRAAQDAEISLAQETASRTEAVWQRLADQGIVTFEQAQKKIAESQLELLAQQERDLTTRLLTSGAQPGTGPFNELDAQLKQIRQRMANFLTQMAADQEEANRREYEREQQHKARLNSIYDFIADMTADTERDRLRILEQMGLRKEEVWKRQAQLEIDVEQMQNQRRLEDLRRQRDYVEKFEKNEERRAEIITAINSQIEAEEKRSAQRRDNIMADYFEKQRQKLREAADKIVDVFKTALDRRKEEGWKGFFKSLGDSFREELERMALDLLKSRVLSLLQTVFKVPQVGTGGIPANAHFDQNEYGGEWISGPDTHGKQSDKHGLLGSFLGLFGVGSVSASGDQANKTATPIVSAVDRSTVQIVAAVRQSQVFNHANLPNNGAAQPGIVTGLPNSFSAGTPFAITSAGHEAVHAITSAGEANTGAVDRTGKSTSSAIITAGQGMVSVMTQMLSIMTNFGATGGFSWKGLFASMAVGAINGAVNKAFGGGGGSQGGLGTVMAGAIGAADGAYVTGPGTSTSDSILAWLSNGEGVVNARATQHYGGRAFIDALNNMQFPRFASGGMVSVDSFASPSGRQSYAATGRGNVENHYHFSMPIYARDAADVKRSEGQIQRQMHQALLRTAARLS